MLASKVFLALAVVAGTNGAPLLSKRIAQTISDSTQKWEQACLAAGGGQQCNPLSITAFSTLLAAPGPCEQQDAADQMIDLAKQLKNDPDMIKFTQIFAQQPRNTPDSLSVPYCQQAPKNQELNGLFQCQFEGANPKVFVGNVNVGGQGTVPFGLNAPLNPPGSCKANPDGPIADGTQLTDITSDPGVGSTGGSAASDSNDGGDNEPISSSSGNNSNGDSSDNSNDNSSNSTTTGSNDGDSGDNSSDNEDGSDNGTDSPDGDDSSANSNANGSGGATSFALSNGQKAQQLNAQFAGLNDDSECTEGENACVNGQFAQCVDGKFEATGCAGGTQCFALPLVNSPGTSVTCDTQADALARIAATGATGGLTGTGN